MGFPLIGEKGGGIRGSKLRTTKSSAEIARGERNSYLQRIFYCFPAFLPSLAVRLLPGGSAGFDHLD